MRSKNIPFGKCLLTDFEHVDFLKKAIHLSGINKKPIIVAFLRKNGDAIFTALRDQKVRELIVQYNLLSQKIFCVLGS